ncbi:hypothetical protein HDV04_001675 [Boothiomyces sp. JEL0838]|nr:hypothetical protein HDV04_001675 [Boothiomyces sp. JEL0838]
MESFLENISNEISSNLGIQLHLKSNRIPIKKIPEEDYTKLVENLKAMRIVQDVQISDNVVTVIPNELNLCVDILNRPRKPDLDGKVAVQFELPMPGVGLSITDIRTIYTALTIGNILKFQGYTVEYLFFFFEWELHTGFLLEGMRKLGRKLLIGEYQSLGEIVMSEGEGDPNIALQNLRKLAEKDPVLSQYWENVCEVVSNHYQEMFNRCNIKMDVVMAKSLRLNEELKNSNGYYSKPETILSKHNADCRTIYVFNQKHKYAFEFAKKQYKTIVLCPVGKCEGLEAPVDLESIIHRAESAMVKKDISDPDELLLAKNLGKSSFILQFNQVNAQTVIVFDGITARNHEMHGIYLQYAHARICGYYDVNVGFKGI